MADESLKKTIQTAWRCVMCRATGSVDGKVCPACDGHPFGRSKDSSNMAAAGPRCEAACSYPNDQPDAVCSKCQQRRPRD